MTEMQVTIVVAFAGMGILFGLVIGLIHRIKRATPKPEERHQQQRLSLDDYLAKDEKKVYVEVWYCPHCNRLSRIARACKWCLSSMPKDVKFLTVPEKEYVSQFSMPFPPYSGENAQDIS